MIWTKFQSPSASCMSDWFLWLWYWGEVSDRTLTSAEHARGLSCWCGKHVFVKKKFCCGEKMLLSPNMLREVQLVWIRRSIIKRGKKYSFGNFQCRIVCTAVGNCPRCNIEIGQYPSAHCTATCHVMYIDLYVVRQGLKGGEVNSIVINTFGIIVWLWSHG